jgi:orotidine-5'-phosphate decarboxylase
MEKLNKRIMLSIGLDTDFAKLPVGLSKDPNGMLEFNKSIIEATSDIADAYKINFAFYERFGALGIEVLYKTFQMLPKYSLSIADAKRVDIGNTSKAYAEAIFEHFRADSVTVNPYMGYDSLEPFLSYKDKIVFILILTSNKGSSDFQRIIIDGKPLYNRVLEKILTWQSEAKIGFVIGATHPEELNAINNTFSDKVLLIPGVGSQGASIGETINAVTNNFAIINVSRDIIFASNKKDFAEKARAKAKYYKDIIMQAL